MPEDDELRSWGTWTILVAAAALALARFVRYIDVVTDTDAAFSATLAWWGSYVAGLVLLLLAAVDQLEGDQPADLRSWIGLLVGVLILVVMPSSPAPAFEFGQALGGAFGG